MGVKDVDKGFQNYYHSMKSLDSQKTAVGIFQEAGEEVLKKAIRNEFGSPSLNIPARSFVASTFHKKHKSIAKDFVTIHNDILRKCKMSNTSFNFTELTLEKLKTIGLKHKKDVKETITNMKYPKNAPLTVALKGIDDPLVHTGEMRSKVSSKVIKK